MPYGYGVASAGRYLSCGSRAGEAREPGLRAWRVTVGIAYPYDG